MIMSYTIKSKIWIEVDEKMLLGEGRVQLLKSIQRTKSLSKSAKEIGISYKKAWSLIDAVNKNAKEPIVQKSTGGSGGGGTIVTSYGLKMIDSFEAINKNCWAYLNKQITKHLNL